MNLKIGDSGADVAALQNALMGIGYFITSVDGQFGPETEAAVKQFQSNYGLTVDGIVGAQTAAAIMTAVSKQAGADGAPVPVSMAPGTPGMPVVPSVTIDWKLILMAVAGFGVMIYLLGDTIGKNFEDNADNADYDDED